MSKAIRWSDLSIERQLGEGNSSSVWLARLETALGVHDAGTLVAVKRFRDWVFDERGQMERFLREVDVGRRVIHPNLLRILSAVVDDKGRPALVMQYYDGKNLSSLLDETPSSIPLPLEFCLSVLRGLAAAIGALHGSGVIHRDVKPANVIVVDGKPVLADFGVVRSNQFPEQTTTGQFIGTIKYAAPEYLFGEKYDQTIDTYSFGAVAYELLTRKHLYGKGAHWARIVVNKAAPSELTRFELRELARIYGLQATTFIRYVIDHSRCERTVRDVDLDAVIRVIDEREWATGTIVGPGPTYETNHRFEDGRTAAEAADELRSKASSETELQRVKRWIYRHFWDRYVPPPESVNLRPLISKARVAVARHHGSPHSELLILESAKQALALGL